MALKKHQTKTSIFEELDVISGSTRLKASSGVYLLIMKILGKNLLQYKFEY